MRKPILAILAAILASLGCVMSVAQVPTPTAPAPPAATATPTAPASPTPAKAAETPETARVLAAVVNIRSTPGGEVVGQIYAGQSVTVLQCVDRWCEIAEPSGWVFAGCLSVSTSLGCQAEE